MSSDKTSNSLLNVDTVVSTVKHQFCKKYFPPATTCIEVANEPTRRLTQGNADTRLFQETVSGLLGDSEWMESGGLKGQELGTTYRPHPTGSIPISKKRGNDDMLIDLWLSGMIRLEDVNDLEKRLKECCLDKQHLEAQIKEMVRKINDKGESLQKADTREKSSTQLLELQALRIKCGKLEKLNQCRIALWDDDLHCGFTLYRELSTLLCERSQQKRKQDLAMAMHHQVAKENETLKHDLESAIFQLSNYRALAKLIEHHHSGIPERKEVQGTIEELKARIDELEDTVKQAIERLIEEQLQREIDEIKANMVLEGLKKRLSTMLDKTGKLETENEILRKKIEELMRIISDLKLKEEDLQQKIDVKEEQLRELMRKNSKWETEIRLLRNQLSELEEANRKFNRKLMELDQTLLLKDDKIRNLERKISLLEDELAAAKHRERLSQKITDDRSAENRQLQIELDILRQNLTESENNTKMKEDGLQLRLGKLENTKDNLQREIQTAQEELFESRNTIDNLRRELSEAKRQEKLERGEFSRQKAELERYLDSLKADLARATTDTQEERLKCDKLNQKISELMKDLTGEKAKQKMRPLLSRFRIMPVEIRPRPVLLRPHRATVRIDRQSWRTPPSVQPCRTITIYPKKKPILSRHKMQISVPPRTKRPLSYESVQNIYLLKELPSPPKRAAISLSPAPKIIGAPKAKLDLTPAQSRLLEGAKTASGELLKRKPTADELAAVAVSGAQQIRSAPPSPRTKPGGPEFTGAGNLPPK